MDVGDVLLGARQILASGRWHKGSAGDDRGNYCAIGAICEIAPIGTNDEERWALNDAAVKALGVHVDGGLIAQFNDAPSTTLADILNAFDKALADLGRLGEVQ